MHYSSRDPHVKPLSQNGLWDRYVHIYSVAADTGADIQCLFVCMLIMLRHPEIREIYSNTPMNDLG